MLDPVQRWPIAIAVVLIGTLTTSASEAAQPNATDEAAEDARELALLEVRRRQHDAEEEQGEDAADVDQDLRHGEEVRLQQDEQPRHAGEGGHEREGAAHHRALPDAGEPAGDDVGYEPLADAATKARSYRGWTKDFADALYRSRRYSLYRSPSLDELSEPGESARDFRIRLADRAREARDEAVEALRKRYASKLKTLGDRVRRALRIGLHDAPEDTTRTGRRPGASPARPAAT